MDLKNKLLQVGDYCRFIRPQKLNLIDAFFPSDFTLYPYLMV